jgi:WD40 repeat protein
LDGSVRLWSLDKDGRGDEECLHLLQSSARERLECVAINPDAQRVVAGGIGHGNSGPAVDDAASDTDEYCVHVWTWRGTAMYTPATADAGEYSIVALAGRTDDVNAVQVSRDRERVVSGSRDGTVRVWNVPPRATMAAADVGPPRVVDLRAATPGHYEDKVTALSLVADAANAFVGMVRGSIHVVDCDSGRIEASLRTDRTAGAEVFCLALVEFHSNSTNGGGGVGGRLFAGHYNGVVSEWDLDSRSCVSVYGDARSGAGFVWSIAGRIVPAAGGQSVEGGGESMSARRVAGDSAPAGRLAVESARLSL